MNEQRLRGSAAVVVGAGRGLGRAIAQALAADGASLALIARTESELAETAAAILSAGGQAVALSGDATDQATVARIAADVEAQLGPIDVLVNSAGAGPPYGPAWESDSEQWWRCVEVNLRAPFLSCRAFLPGMVARRRGRIINLASGAGTRAVPYMSAYAVSKGALIRLTETLAAETRRLGIGVFALEPGTVRTAMTEEALFSPEGQKWLPWFRRIFDEGRDSGPEPVAALALALARGEADALSGRLISVSDDLRSLLGGGKGPRSVNRAATTV